MAITIQIFERTGPAGSPDDQLVTNMNWKSQSLNDALHKYYYFPIRLPQGDILASYSVPKYLYAKISGTYSKIKRIRWKIVGPAEDGILVRMGTSASYSTPQPKLHGDLTWIQDNTEQLIVPRLSTTSPTGSPQLLNTLAANTTYFTDFLVTQLMITSPNIPVGNTEEVGIMIVLDEYE